MSDHCPECPCPTICLRFPLFCEWARTGDALQKRHICGRSAMRADFVPRSKLAENFARMRAAKLCAFRSVDPGCGCSGARCALKVDPLGPTDPPRRGGIVSIRECAACIERYG